MLAELGLPVALVEDEHRFILAYHILWDTSDVEVAVAIIDAVQAAFPEFNACSFDRGFHSLKNREALDARLALNALPKKGKLSLAGACAGARACVQGSAGGSTRPSSRCLANFGLRGGALVRQKSPENFALMVSLSVLAVNVHRLGCLVRRPGTGTNKASAKARGVGPLPPRRKVPIAGPKGHVCPPDRNTTPFEPQTARARTQETPAWPKQLEADRQRTQKTDRAYALNAEKREYSVNHYIGTRPSKKSVQSICRKISEQTAARHGLLSIEEMVTRLNWLLTRWAKLLPTWTSQSRLCSHKMHT